MSTKVLIVCDSFKESLVASDVAKAIARGIGAADAAARCTLMPFSDGGEGAIEVLEQNLNTAAALEAIVLLVPLKTLLGAL